ncbi:MAG: hypothetical protein QOG01_3283 [Pseudonocardiales bacterium]|jgi:hypothetical protein|nr:hypothetical protein [Pseudonocardiales bacterium]
MHLIDVVLFLHIAVAIAAFGVATVLHTIQWSMRNATSMAQLKTWNPILHRIEPMFPILALILFALGGWLIGLSDGEFAWGDGWVITAIVGLALMEIVGGVLINKRSKNTVVAIAYADDGPIPSSVNAFMMNPVLWAASHFETGTALGILYLMATKPSGLASVAIVAICALAGIGVGALGARVRVAEPAEPAGAAELPATA